MENPPDTEEMVPLQSIGEVPSPSPVPQKRLLDREYSDTSMYSRRSSDANLRRASSLEHMHSSSSKLPGGNDIKALPGGQGKLTGELGLKWPC